jgi:hypothetical protein
MKKPLIFILLIIAGQSFAQRFYLRPKIECRSSFVATTGNSRPHGFQLINFEYTNELIQNKYLHIATRPIDLQSGFNIGLNLGYKLKNKNRIELGWNQDASGENIRFADARNFTANLYSGLQTEIWNHRFEILHFKRLFPENHQNKNLHFSRTYLVLGGGIKYQNVPKKGEQTVDDYLLHFSSFSDYPNRIDADHFVYGINRFSTFLTIGLSTDLFFREKYLFSCNLNYQQGSFQLTSTSHQFKIYEDNVLIDEYFYHTSSRGSGFVFQISRTFQVYPRKKKKR